LEKSFFEIKESSRAGLRSLAPLLRVADNVQAQRRSDESKMRECLRPSCRCAFGSYSSASRAPLYFF
jgi:hypothetical protein